MVLRIYWFYALFIGSIGLWFYSKCENYWWNNKLTTGRQKKKRRPTVQCQLECSSPHFYVFINSVSVCENSVGGGKLFISFYHPLKMHLLYKKLILITMIQILGGGFQQQAPWNWPGLNILCPQLLHFHEHDILFIILKYDHITPVIYYLHWLPIKFRISYKILLLPFKALNGLALAYLTSLLSRYNPTRSPRSQNSGLLVVPRIAKSTKGGRTFS